MKEESVHMAEKNLVKEAYKKALSTGGKTGLNCIAELDPACHSKGNDSLPLYGIPVLVKDNIDVKGLHTTAGSLVLSDNIAKEDAPVIRNLRRNGAAIFGKTNMTEFANYVDPSMPAGYSSRGGQVIHAGNPRLSPSGSSTGSAVAVSAGIVSMAVGTDTCHSITACAKFNGICGLKPPAGTLSKKGIIPISKTLDSAGALADSLENALKLYSAMRDEALEKIEPKKIGKLQVAVNIANAEVLSDAENAFIRNTVEKIRAAGGQSCEVNQPPAPHLPIIMKYEFKPGLEEYLGESSASMKTLSEIVSYYEDHPETMMKYGASFLKAALLETPGGLKSPEYLDAVQIRKETIRKVTDEISGFDAVIMSGPTSMMHFCGFPTVTIASSERDETGVNTALILYGTDEYRLYAAALAIEELINENR